MKIILAISEMSAWSATATAAGQTIALVPTMGYFHEGHLRLMRQARELADLVAVSLFVNPLQFGIGEDLAKYPRDLNRDAAMAAEVGVDVLFSPSSADMYPEGFETQVTVERLSRGLCGGSRPGHFAGVTTVVAKLFHIARPGIAIFGQKDFQQLAVINRMVRDLNWDIRIVAHPIVRESSGLAMSSRNSYLSEDERHSAHCLYRAIQHARDRVSHGERTVAAILGELHDLIHADPAVLIDYVKIVDRETLLDQALVDRHSVLLLAVLIGRTRLIDNAVLLEGDVGS